MSTSGESIDLEQMAQEARDMGMTTAGVLAYELEISIQRDYAYLARRKERGTHTPTDEAMARTALAKSLVILYLRRVPEQTPV